MNPLRIRLFGGLQLWRGKSSLPPFETARARSLFAFVALHRTRPHARDQLIGQLWGDQPQDSARKALRMALWRVRAVVDPAGSSDAASPIRASASAVEFNSDADYWLDVEEFERLVREAVGGPDQPLRDREADRLRAAVDLYRGDLLEDIYDEWCLFERERLRLIYHSALERLMRLEQERSAWHEAIALGQRLLALDPLLESVHRELMRCHASRGDRAAALRQFDLCERTLRRELDVEPMQETLDLQDRIRADAAAPAHAADERALLERMDRALEVINSIAAQLQTCRDRLLPSVAPAPPSGGVAGSVLLEATPGRR